MASREHARVLARLRQLLAKHGTQYLSQQPPGPPRRAYLAEAAQELAIPRSTIHDLAVRHNIPRRRKAISLAKKRNLERELAEAKLTISKIAAKLKIAKSTVSLASRARIDNDPRAKITFRPRLVKKPRRCPKHGKINTDVCIACAAEEERAKRFPGNG